MENAVFSSSVKMGRGPFYSYFTVIFLLLCCMSFNYFFQNNCTELGDLAANALQSLHAKQFQEIHGNYSRWNFNHPGPAFFYLYGFGERLFFDTLKITQSPYAAHALMGFFIQFVFFVMSIGIASTWVKNRLFPFVACALGAVHFGLVQYAFYSLWPPHVLLFPFLCLMISCSSVAAGKGEHLPFAIVSGGMLLHGHVAQPLFVVPSLLLAYFGLFLNRMSQTDCSGLGDIVRRYKKEHILAGMMVGVFAFPLIVDLFHWPHSNLKYILNHLRQHRGEGHKFYQSLVYFLSYFTYFQDQEKLGEKFGRDLRPFLLNHLPILLGWMTGLAICWFGLVRDKAKNGIDPVFRKALTGFWFMAIVLTLIWGIKQDGVMYNFNSYFNSAILFIPVLGVGVLVSQVIDRMVSFPVGWVTVLLLNCFAFKIFLTPVVFSVDGGNRIGPVVEKKLQEYPSAQPVLVFDISAWYMAIGVALQLERLGQKWAVLEDYGCSFGRDRTVKDPSDLKKKGLKSVVWKIEPTKPGAISDLPGDFVIQVVAQN